MEIEPFSRRMIELMPRMIRGISSYEHNSLSRGEITLPQLWALEHLAREGRLSMNALAKALRISRPAGTGLVDRLIAQGLARRCHDEKDRRIVWVEATPKGRRAVGDIWEQKRRMIVRLFGRISSADRSQYLATLEKITAMLGGREAPKP